MEEGKGEAEPMEKEPERKPGEGKGVVKYDR